MAAERSSQGETAAPQWGRQFQFSLKALLLVTLLLAFCLGLLQSVIVAGVAFALLSAPALWRTMRIARGRAAAGAPLSSLARVGVFLWSLQIVTGLVLAGLAAAICGILSAALVIVITAARIIVRGAILIQNSAHGADKLRCWLFRATASCASANMSLLRRYCAT